jgi:hypothetical protein
MLERLDGKLSRAVLRGERGRKAPDLPGLPTKKESQLMLDPYASIAETDESMQAQLADILELRATD